jgi:hypothetical protein
MTRIALLALTAGCLLAQPVAHAARPIDPAPLMDVKEMKGLPGTPVPIVVPAPSKRAPLMKGDLKELPGTVVPVDPPRLPAPGKR